jgi:hypothetical protein
MTTTTVIANYKNEIVSLENQIAYCNTALSNELQSWECKEYESVKSECVANIEQLNRLIKTIESL